MKNRANKNLGAAAFDTNAAAKLAGSVPLKPNMLAIIDTLAKTRDQHVAMANESIARLNAYAEQCAEMCGVKPEDFALNLDLKAFTPIQK